MKLKTHGTFSVFLGLFLALGLFLSFAPEAPAHDGSDADINAKDVGINNEEEMMKFLEHVVGHFNQIQNDKTLSQEERNRELSIIGRRFREEGVFYHKTTNVYSMGVNSRHSITSHPAYPNLYGMMIDLDQNSDTTDVVAALLKSTTTKVECQKYTHGGENRIACGQKVNSPSGEVTTIVGLHHADDDDAIILPSCDNFTLQTTAKDVYDDPTNAKLEAYVKEIIRLAKDQVKEIIDKLAMEDPNTALKAFQGDQEAIETFRVKQLERLYDTVACFGNNPNTKHKNIYAFVMDTDPAGTVLMNGNNFGLIGLDLQVNDNELPGEDKSIANLFRNKLTGGSGEPKDGQKAFVDYRWDDPTTDEDNIANWFEDKSVPGSSPKRSYIEVANLYEKVQGADPVLYIFGSGIYNPDTGGGNGSSDSDGGCAIATGHAAPQGAVLNLLLAGAVLFSIVFLKKRG